MSNVKSSRLDFTGQPIYIGLDVHKKSWSVSIFSEQIEHKTFTQPPEVDKLVNYLRRTFPGALYHSVYEAGYSGFWIHDRLKEKGIDCTVVNPADVPTKDKERVTKRDRIDCRKLARGLRSGEIEGIYVPSRTKLEDRSLVRTRQSMVRKQTRDSSFGRTHPEPLVPEVPWMDREYPHGEGQWGHGPQGPSGGTQAPTTVHRILEPGHPASGED